MRPGMFIISADVFTIMKRHFLALVPTPKRKGVRGRKYALNHYSRLPKKP